MSTWEPWSLSCPECRTVQTVPLLKGIHISRLPDVRRAILDGSFQTFDCPGCARRIQVEASTVCTDFPHHDYMGLEVRGTRDWRAARARHLAIFDSCFTFGPDPVAELGSGLRTRLVFGNAALREKLLLWEHGLDDRVVEALKGECLALRGLGPTDEELRVSQILEGGHLVFARMEPAELRDLPPRELVPISPYKVLGFETVPAPDYERRQLSAGKILRDWPALGDDWVVDLHVCSR